ncbi:helix-turn-helix domain-containing protein [Eisenbergiella sp.]
MEPKDMGTKIRNARMAKGMTQKQLAAQVHVTDKAVSKWERGVSQS